MKKNIILGIALTLASLQQLTAQDSTQLSASVAKHFEESFAGAKNVTWTFLPKKIAQAQFFYNGGSWVAYFDHAGNIITSGRRIKSAQDLPLKVQAGLRRAKARMVKKGGEPEIVIMYEMLQDNVTKYFVSLRNEITLANFSISSEGSAVLENKKPRTAQPQAPKDAIARKN